MKKKIKKVSEDTQNLNFNTAISQMMIFVNEATKFKNIQREVLEDFLKLLCPYAPHITEELWEKLGNKSLLCKEKWPQFIESYCVEDMVNVMVSVNGKVKGKLDVKAGTSKDELIALSFQSECVKRLSIKCEDAKKIIVVPDKIINIVI